MSVHPLCYITSSVSQDTTLCCLIGAGVVQERGYGVAAVVGSVVTTDKPHHLIPYSAVPAVGVRPAGDICYKGITGLLHPGSDERQDTVMDRYGTDTCLGLGVSDPYGSLSEIHILLTDGKHLSTSHACVEQDQYGIYAGLIYSFPKPVYPLSGKAVMGADGMILTNPQ